MLRPSFGVRMVAAAVTILLATGGAASSCGSKKSGGPAPATSAPASVAPPVEQADNPPPPSLYNGTTGGWDCAFYSVSTTEGTGIDLVPAAGTNAFRLKGEVDVQCTTGRIPTQFHMFLEVWTLPSLGTKWVPVTGTSWHLPPILRKKQTMYFACNPGLYFIDMQASGVSSTGRPFKAGSQTTMVTLSKAKCAGH